MRRLVFAACACLALGACSGQDPVAIGRSATSSTALATTVTTLAPTTSTTLTPQADLAARLTAAETSIRDPATPASQLSALGQAQQQAYRSLVAHPEWDAGVLALVPQRLRPTVEANVSAGRELAALTPAPPPDTPLPKWRIVAPDPAEQLIALYKAAGAAARGVPWEYLAAIHLVETRMGRIKGDSSAGARGPMQFIPTTWDIYGEGDIMSNRDSIYAAARYLRATGAPSDMARALRAYNNSARYVRAVTAYARQIEADERAYLGYHAWQVYYGARLLPEGTVIE